MKEYSPHVVVVAVFCVLVMEVLETVGCEFDVGCWMAAVHILRFGVSMFASCEVATVTVSRSSETFMLHRHAKGIHHTTLPKMDTEH